MNEAGNSVLDSYSLMHGWETGLVRMEASLLGTLLVAPALIEKTFLRIDEKGFHTVAGGQLLFALHDLYAHKKDPALALVVVKLESLYGPFRGKGNWFEYLAELMNHADPVDETIDDYVDILISERMKKRIA